MLIKVDDVALETPDLGGILQMVEVVVLGLMGQVLELGQLLGAQGEQEQFIGQETETVRVLGIALLVMELGLMGENQEARALALGQILSWDKQLLRLGMLSFVITRELKQFSFDKL